MEPAIELVEAQQFPRGEWDALAAASANVFATPEWCETWRAELAPDVRAQLLVCRDGDGRARAVWPLYEARRGPLRVVRLLGHGPADELGPACAPEDRPLAAAALREALATGRLGGRVLVAERLAAEAPWPDLLRGRVLHREASPVLPVDGQTWEQFLAAQSRNFREQAGRRTRRLERAHDVEFHLTRSVGELREDYADLVALHRARWAQGGSEAFAGALEGFHRAFAARALERGWLRLWVLRVDGRAVAAWHGFRYAGGDNFYQAGRDPSWDKWSVGFILNTHTVRVAFEDGMREYRLLRGDEGYKGRWAEHDRPVDIVAAAPGRLGATAVGAAARMAGSRRLRPLMTKALAG